MFRTSRRARSTLAVACLALALNPAFACAYTRKANNLVANTRTNINTTNKRSHTPS